jgi:high-affinity iron transporter
MLQALIITLREGLEAFLIVAISLAYLRKTGRRALVPAIHWGIAGSIALSIGAGLLLAKARNQSLWEGVLAIVAAFMVASLTIHMWRAGRHMKKDIEGKLAVSSLKTGRAAFWGVFGFTLLMITREGMETAMLMNALLFQVQAMNIAAGAIGGTLIAAFIAFLWSRYGHRVNLSRFFQVTAIFLLVFVVQLLIYGFHELAEANVLPNSEALHGATEPYGPDGVYGHYLTYLLVALPLGWLSRACSGGVRARRRHSPMKPPTTLELIWEHDLVLRGRSGDASIVLDGAGQAGPSPVQALAFALAGCMGMDVVHILRKGRFDLRGLKISLTADRAPEDPHRITAVAIDFTVTGDVPKDQVRRAIDLSHDKYCSVWHSMRQDIAFTTTFSVGAGS